MDDSFKLDTKKIALWLSTSMSIDAITKDLSSLGIKEETIALYLQAYEKAKVKKRQSLGFIFLGIGSILGFLSCVLSIINPVPDFLGVFLYGFTPLSVIIVFIGLYLVFE